MCNKKFRKRLICNDGLGEAGKRKIGRLIDTGALPLFPGWSILDWLVFELEAHRDARGWPDANASRASAGPWHPHSAVGALRLSRAEETLEAIRRTGSLQVAHDAVDEYMGEQEDANAAKADRCTRCAGDLSVGMHGDGACVASLPGSTLTGKKGVA